MSSPVSAHRWFSSIPWLNHTTQERDQFVALPVRQNHDATRHAFEEPGLHEVGRRLDADLDVVFVHGLTGSHSTWQHPKGSFWPSLLAEDFPKARIFLWVYDADVFRFFNSHTASGNRLHDHSVNFCDRLGGRRVTTKTQGRPLIFICHSLGGLVTTKCLVHAGGAGAEEPLYKDLYDSTIGTIFLGTPFRGSGFARWGSSIAGVVRVSADVNRDIVRLLKPDSEILNELRDSFVRLVMRSRNESRPDIRVKCYFEELGLPHVTAIGKVVTRESAVLDGLPWGSIHADHSGMTKFENRDSPGYTSIVEWISYLLQQTAQQLQLYAEQSIVPHKRASSPLESVNRPHRIFHDDSDGLYAAFQTRWRAHVEEPSKDFRDLRGSPKRTSDIFRRNEQSRSQTSGISDYFAMPPTRSATLDVQPATRTHSAQSESSSVSQSLFAEASCKVTARVAEVADWFSKINHQNMHDFTSSTRHQESGIWLSEAETFLEWRNRPVSSLFWLIGSAGSGKSVLSSFVVDALSANPDVQVFYFYCNRRHGQAQRSHIAILRSLLKQAYLLAKPSKKEIAEDFYLKHRDEVPCDGNISSLEAYFDLFLDLLSSGRVYIVLDGLDEGTRDCLDRMSEAWMYISKKARHVVKLFVSSRPSSHVESFVRAEFRRQPSAAGAMRMDDQAQHKEDVASYVAEEVANVVQDWREWQSHPANDDLVKFIGAGLTEASNARFSVSSAAIDYMKTQNKNETPSTQSSQPLDLVYKLFMAEIASGSPFNTSLVERALYWTVFALEPLSASAVVTALNLQLDILTDDVTPQPCSIIDLQKHSRDLLIVRDERLQLVHPSAQEYLSQTLNSALAHTYLAKMCFSILTTMTPAKWCDAEKQSECNEERQLYEYAKRYCQVHGWRAIALDQRIGPFIHPDDLPGIEERHQAPTVDQPSKGTATSQGRQHLQ